MKEPEMLIIAELIVRTLTHMSDSAEDFKHREKIKTEARNLALKFPVYV